MTVVHNDTPMWTALKLHVGLGLDFVFVCLFKFTLLCTFLCERRLLYSCVACFHCVRFNLFVTKARDWLGRTSPKWRILCWVGCKTLTPALNQHCCLVERRAGACNNPLKLRPSFCFSVTQPEVTTLRPVEQYLSMYFSVMSCHFFCLWKNSTLVNFVNWFHGK